jgi:hypothetical protein
MTVHPEHLDGDRWDELSPTERTAVVLEIGRRCEERFRDVLDKLADL